ncbi:MAG: hypothetical protein WCI05_02540 [Myxococcales bacterium]|jgi:hypothetical protein
MHTESFPSGRFFSLGTKLAVVTVAGVALASVLVFFEITNRERARLVGAKQLAAAMVAEIFKEALVALRDKARKGTMAASDPKS